MRSGTIVLIMLMIHFNGRFNAVSLAVPILNGFWLWDAHTGFIFSVFINIFIETEGLIFLSKVNVANFFVITLMAFLGSTIVRMINSLSNDVKSRYAIFYISMTNIFILAYLYAGKYINVNWLGISHIKVD